MSASMEVHLKTRNVVILGSTGSVGTNTLSVIRNMAGDFRVTGLSAHTNAADLIKQAAEFLPEKIALSGLEPRDFSLPEGTKALFGADALPQLCDGADLVVLAVVGIAGLPAFEYCLRNRIPVALANKEAMVCGGKVARRLMDETGTTVLPVDSELSAIFQCMEGRPREQIKHLWLTASGGPFRTKDKAFIEQATKGDALRHPNWDMGQKITIDCATMLNKGLEIMETRWLFDIPSSQIKVVVHPESIVHSMVELTDGSVIAQLGVHDMQLPIEVALAYPHRKDVGVEPLDLFRVGSLHFEQPDMDRFPCLRLAYQVLSGDSALQLVLNSANEVAVAAFLQDKIRFAGIPGLIEEALSHFAHIRVESFADIYGADREVRRFTQELVEKIS